MLLFQIIHSVFKSILSHYGEGEMYWTLTLTSDISELVPASVPVTYRCLLPAGCVGCDGVSVSLLKQSISPKVERWGAFEERRTKEGKLRTVLIKVPVGQKTFRDSRAEISFPCTWPDNLHQYSADKDRSFKLVRLLHSFLSCSFLFSRCVESIFFFLFSLPRSSEF